MNKRAQWSWILIDVGNSAFATTILAALFPIYLHSLLPEAGVSLSLFGLTWTSTALSIWGYTVSASLVLSLILSLLLGSWADESGLKIRLLSIFTFLGCLGTLCLAFVDSWPWALACFVIGNIGFSGNTIFSNALLSDVAEEKDWHSLSLKGFAWGYVGGGLLLALNILSIKKYEWFGLASTIQGVKLSFISVGLWWLAWTIPSLLWISEKPKEARAPFRLGERLKGLKRTFVSIPTIPSLLVFMIGYAFFNDGIQTVIAMASLFAREVLHLTEATILGVFLMVQFLGLPLTLFVISISKKWGAKQTLIASLVFWIGLIVYAYSMTNATDFWILGALVPLVQGPSQSLARSIYAGLIPQNRQAEFFAFFALSGKMTSVLGPLIFGLVRDLTQDSRLPILSLVAFFIIGLICLSFVSIDPRRSEP